MSALVADGIVFPSYVRGDYPSNLQVFMDDECDMFNVFIARRTDKGLDENDVFELALYWRDRCGRKSGYNFWLSREQLQKLYIGLTGAFQASVE